LIRLYAVVPADGAGIQLRGTRVSSWGALAAIAGSPRGPGGAVGDAICHGRIVAGALRRCWAVVPFRSGVEVGSEAEVHDLLRLNADQLSRQLLRFRGRVEVGLRARWVQSTALERCSLPAGLERVRQLATRPGDRQERLARGADGTTLVACYLISRRAVGDFWRALDDIRRAVPAMPLLGSGPFAPYSFCDVPLMRAAERGGEQVTW
jgi:hypothetical protein